VWVTIDEAEAMPRLAWLGIETISEQYERFGWASHNPTIAQGRLNLRDVV
jgi:hypothetical protein